MPDGEVFSHDTPLASMRHAPITVATGSVRPDSARPTSVRVAGPGDEARLLNLFIDAHADNAFARMDVTRMADWAGIFCRHPEGKPLSVCGVIDGDRGALAGCAGLVLFQPWFSSDWAIEEIVIFARPEARSLAVADALLAFCKDYARKLGLPLYIGIRSKARVAGKERLFDAHFTRRGAFYSYEPGTATHEVGP